MERGIRFAVESIFAGQKESSYLYDRSSKDTKSFPVKIESDDNHISWGKMLRHTPVLFALDVYSLINCDLGSLIKKCILLFEEVFVSDE